MAAKQKTCTNESSLMSYAPITQRLKVQQPQMNQFWPAVRQFPAQNFKGKHTCKKTTAVSQNKRRKIERVTEIIKRKKCSQNENLGVSTIFLSEKKLNMMIKSTRENN